MRVLHVGKYYPPFAGGIEHFLADLLPALRGQGVTVAALVHDSPATDPSPPAPLPGGEGSAGLAPLPEGEGSAGLAPLPGGEGSAGLAPLPEGEGSARLRGAEEIRIYRAPSYGRLLYAPVSPAFPFWLARAIREFCPDLLHLHLPNTSAFWALLVPAARRLPWVIHWHADVVSSAIDRRLALAYRLYRPFEQRLLAASRAVIATSPPYLDASAALAPWRERCHLIPLGLDPARIPDPDPAAQRRAEALWNASPTPSLAAGKGGSEGDERQTPSPPAGEGGGGGEPFRILAIGRLTYYKGHDVLIRAAAELPGSRVLIVGTGEQRQRLATLIQTLDLGDRVHLLGFQPESDLNALLAGCDVLCLPSLERTEAFGLVLLEAMRFGKPVVVGDIPGSGAGWVTRQAGHGLLAPPGDAPALAAALRELQHDPVKRAALGQAGALALKERFGVQPVAVAIADLYRQLTDGGKS